MIFILPFVFVGLFLIYQLFIKQRKSNKENTDNVSDNINYTVHDTTTSSNDFMSHSYKKENSNSKNMSTPQAIYTLIFSLLWNGILITMISTVSNFEPVFIFTFIPFIVIGVFLFVSSIKSIIKSTQNKGINNHQNIENTDIKNDEYFVKYCINCGENLSPTDKYCPNCGKEVK